MVPKKEGTHSQSTRDQQKIIQKKVCKQKLRRIKGQK